MSDQIQFERQRERNSQRERDRVRGDTEREREVRISFYSPTSLWTFYTFESKENSGSLFHPLYHQLPHHSFPVRMPHGLFFFYRHKIYDVIWWCKNRRPSGVLAWQIFMRAVSRGLIYARRRCISYADETQRCVGVGV